MQTAMIGPGAGPACNPQCTRRSLSRVTAPHRPCAVASPRALGAFSPADGGAALRRAGSRLARRSRASVVVEAKSGRKVALLGAAGGIGQPLALLLKMQTRIGELALYDIANTKGVAADLSHCNTEPEAKGYTGADELAEALTGCDLVVIPAGVPRKPGMTRDDLFNINASIVQKLAEACAEHCPQAILNIISNPVNSTVPITAEVYKKAGVYDPKKILGVTTLDVVRSNTFAAQLKGLSIEDVFVPVVGGHAGITILPLLSQAMPKLDLTEEEVKKLTERIQNAGTEVVEAKAGAGSATLSMAYAAARMAENVLRGLDGEEDMYEYAYVASNVTELPYFASNVRLGPGGAEQVFDLGKLSPFEEQAVKDLIPVLKKNIDTGVEFATKKETAEVKV